MITLAEMLAESDSGGGSDLHLYTNSPPQIRVDGNLRPMDAARSYRRPIPSGSPTAS